MKALLATLWLGFSILAGTFLLPTTSANGQSNSEFASLNNAALCERATQVSSGNVFNIKWHKAYDPKISGAVKEAKRRGLHCGTCERFRSELNLLYHQQWQLQARECKRRNAANPDCLSCGADSPKQSATRSTSASSRSSSSSSLANLNATRLCSMATVSGNPRRWDPNSTYSRHVAEAKRRGLSCNVGTSTRTATRSSTTSAPSRSTSRSRSAAQSSGNFTFCYDPSQTLAYRTEKPSCDTNDLEITSAEYDRRKGSGSSNSSRSTSSSTPARAPAPPRFTGNSNWGVFGGSEPSIPVAQALAVCRADARSAASRAERNYRDDNTRVNCRRNWSGGMDCSQSNSATGKGAWIANLANGIAEASQGKQASDRSLKSCMAREGYTKR